MIDREKQFIRSPKLVSAAMDGESVMMSLDKGLYFGLKGIGGRVWELLEQPRSLGELVGLLCGEYAADEARISADLQVFLGALLDQQLIAAI